MDWKARAEREAAAIIAQAYPNTSLPGYDWTVALVAIGWLQGYDYGAHETLRATEEAFEELRAAL